MRVPRRNARDSCKRSPRSRHRETVLQATGEVLIYTSISLILFLAIVSIGIVDDKLRSTRPLVDLSGKSPQRPIMDQTTGVGEVLSKINHALIGSLRR